MTKVISGTTTIPADDPENVQGDTVQANDFSTIGRGTSSNSADGLLPSWCPSQDLECNDGSAGNLGTATKSDQNECMRYCKENSCKAVQWVSGTTSCLISDAACSTALVAGTGLYMQRMVVGETECANGVSPVGLPEDDLTDKFCEKEEESCEDGDVMKVREIPTLEECMKECRSTASCRTAVFTKIANFRRCDLRGAPCKGTLNTNSTATTLLRMNTAERLAWKQAVKDGTVDSDPSQFCPNGGKLYVPANPGLSDTFCVMMGKRCPVDANGVYFGNMYGSEQGLTRDKCVDKCNHIPECRMAQYYIRPDGIEKCQMMDDLSGCQDADMTDALGYRNFLRLPEGATGECSGTRQKAPVSSPWKAKFCINLGKACTGPATQPVQSRDLDDCLTQCYLHQDRNCAAATYSSSSRCVLLKGTCTDAQLTTDAGTDYYLQVDAEVGVCPAAVCTDPNSESKDTAICPDTCDNPQASKRCDIGTTTCACKDGFIQDDSGTCVTEASCNAPPAENCPDPTPAQLIKKPQVISLISAIQNIAVPSLVAPGGVCVDNASLQDGAPGCPNTCAARQASQNCRLAKVKACVCGSGFVAHGGKCIATAQCP